MTEFSIIFALGFLSCWASHCIGCLIGKWISGLKKKEVTE